MVSQQKCALWACHGDDGTPSEGVPTAHQYHYFTEHHYFRTTLLRNNTNYILNLPPHPTTEKYHTAPTLKINYGPAGAALPVRP